ncbi:MAG: DmsC/YnfH family molybdoenzyme membrane anchor subunit [Caldimonas sp.]
MNPAFSVIAFTLLAGAAQGLVVVLAVAVLAGVPLAAAFVSGALLLAAAMLVAGLGASFLHLGRPERAWRAAFMWRTSWLSREVIVLPAFIGVVLAWWLALRMAAAGPLAATLLPLAAIAVALVLWLCTAMIYACLRFIEEWAQPLTILNFALIGMAAGGVLAAALAAFAAESALLRAVGPAALVLTLLAGAGRWAAVSRNAALRHRSTLQTATGIHSPRLVQKSMGMSAGSFNTREFFHHVSLAAVVRIRWVAALLGFAAPAALAAWGWLGGGWLPWAAAAAAQTIGLAADRWFFFAQARHPQNLYYQVVS